MASSYHGSSEPPKTEQIITEFFAKSLHIILESRSPPCVSSRNYSGEQILLSSPSPTSSSSSSSSVRPRDKWFNLALKECPAALENLDLWRQSNLEPMVVDVVLVKRPVDIDPVGFEPSGQERLFPSSWNSRREGFMNETKSERIIERWIVQYESGRVVRILDMGIRGVVIHNFSLAHRVSSFVEPFTHREEKEMHHFGFTPVETSCGRIFLSVLYCPTLSDVNSEPSTPMSPRFIPDYVGSPTTNPLKRFPSLPRIGLESQESPSSFPFARSYSWSYDVFRNSVPSISPSPSPTYSDSHAIPSKLSSHQPQLGRVPHNPPENLYSYDAALANKNISFDEFWPTPMFSPSPSPSPPTYITANHLSNALLRTESAPVSIPIANLGKSSALPGKYVPPPSPSPRGTKPNSTSQTDKAIALMKPGDIQKISSFTKDEVANLSGPKLSSHGSPRISFSRSSGRYSFQDEFDDSEFCPFAVDDIDIIDPRIRAESFEGKRNQSEPLHPSRLYPVKKSQDAAVGSLVRMLKAAPPLGQDFSSPKVLQVSNPDIMSRSIQESKEKSDSEVEVVQRTASDCGITSSGILTLKTTSEALDELQGYRAMKEMLLKQGGESHTFANVPNAEKPVDKGGT
ncbi:hypothetical protein IFM89_018380 [Coptis chinensis]|uniref:Autophagy-related protein 13 N-terminal domain-containing protein n=1 Tax=Coptis chinensis TaxID=261450 RepID=A0A835LN90_9MAGN|nr:hypothetical protein IFM89_018380 [Coptis chinensis]